jgi:hypothetical protein
MIIHLIMAGDSAQNEVAAAFAKRAFLIATKGHV